MDRKHLESVPGVHKDTKKAMRWNSRSTKPYDSEVFWALRKTRAIPLRQAVNRKKKIKERREEGTDFNEAVFNVPVYIFKA